MASGLLAKVAGAGLLCIAAAASDARPGALSRFDTPAVAGLPVTSSDLTGIWTDRVVVKLRRVDDRHRFVVGSTDARLRRIQERWHLLSIQPAVQDVPHNAVRAAKFGLDRFHIVQVAAGTDTAALASELNELSDLVELAETDPVGVLHEAPSDPGLSHQWAMSNTGQVVASIPGRSDADIDWLEAWAIPRAASVVVVAVLDTGLSVSHPDLAGQAVPGRCFICGTGDPTNTDDNTTLSHGTLCAGIIAAATNNGIGVCGVSGAAKVMPLKVTTGLLASQTYTGNGLIWAADHGASVASMSWGFGSTANVSFLRSAVEYANDAGMLLVASTGNTPGGEIGYPARWPEVIAVGATNNLDQLFAATTIGPEIDLVAPGQDIYTTVDQNDARDGYSFVSGTSMAVPMVAAAAAEIWAMKPVLNAAEVRQILEMTSDDLGSTGWDSSFGSGRLNLLSAIRSISVLPPVCSADYNDDGRIELSDLFAFLQDYFALSGTTGTNLRPDVDGSGTIDVQDLFTFVQSWFAGC